MIIETLFILTSIYLWSIVFHELGHILFFIFYLKKYPDVRITTKPLTLKIGYPLDYKFMSKPELNQVNMIGILFGFIPLLFVHIFFKQPIVFLISILLVTIYLIGCKGDIKRIVSMIK